MRKPRSVAVYARISSDPDGTALAVARQVADCHQTAEHLGWVVAEEYVDNDISAYSGKHRPAYERMLVDLAEGRRDGVVAYHLDRLTRRPIELEHFVEVVNRAGVGHVRFVSGGDMDVAGGDGLMVVRMMAAFAANESATKSRRQRRKNDEVAAAGLPSHGGSNRPFGYEADKITVRLDEADVIRRVVLRYLAGESLRSIATWLDAEGVRTVAGGLWKTPTLRTLVASPRIAGLRVHRGEVIGRAMWDPIITETQRDRVLARQAELAISGRRSARRYLLSGMLRCGKCGNRLFSSAKVGSRRYVCLSGPDHGGCGRLTVVAPPVEELVTAAVLYRLDTPELADALAGRAADDTEAAAIADTLAADRALLDELAGMVAAKAVSAREWMAARSPILERIDQLERRYSRLTSSDELAGLVGNSAELRRQWAGLNLGRQVAIVKAVVDHGVIATGTSGARALDPNRVEIIWRL